MRPVKKNNPNQVYAKYGDARSDLIEQLGEYCSYCERYIPVSLAVEHVKPKDSHEDLELVWDNFLLACTNCNSTKNDEDVKLNDYFWPHMDNTLIPFVYDSDGLIAVNDELSDSQKEMAHNTLKLTGLDKKPKGTDKTVSNRLWKQRKEAWSVAKKQLERLERFPINQHSEIIDIILPSANQGFFSIWITVFKDYPEMIEKLIEKFTGTAVTKDTLFDIRTDYRSLL
jgi:uncharacterized protein (TIGR02646 family)